MEEAEVKTRVLGESAAPERSFADGIPVLKSCGKSLARAWENSLISLWNGGCHIENQYEENHPKGHQLSVDATMVMVITDPLSEPAIHRCFPGGLGDLEEYRLEMMEGIKDHWTARNSGDPDHWTYTYHERLWKYSDGFTIDDGDGMIWKGGINQVARCLEQISNSPYTRRAQVVTWMPWVDQEVADPSCLQSVWLRCSRGPDGRLVLNSNVRYRSRDAYKAAFWNAWVNVCLIIDWAKQLSLRIGEPVHVGRMVDISDSYHIYGQDVRSFTNEFLGGLSKSFEDRTWTREFCQPFFDEARPEILKKVREHDERNK